MKYFVGPFNLHKRDAAVKKLVRRGYATDDELFEAQFTNWPVNGLSKDTDCSDIVHFKGFYKDPDINPLSYLFRLGHARKEQTKDGVEKHTVHLNGLLLSPLAPVLGLAAGRMALARLHDVGSLFLGVEAPMLLPELAASAIFSSYRYAIASSFVKLLTPSLSSIVGEEQIHIRQLRDPEHQGIAQAAFQNVANDWLNNQGTGKRAWTGIKQAIDAVLTLMPRASLAADPELQARMHNVIARGSVVWGQIPQTPDELYIALQDVGIKAPSKVKKYYRDPQFDTLKETFYRHSAGEGLFSPPNAEMNIGLNSYRDPDILDMYWRDCLLALYGDLLVMYGDSKGREKMGFSSGETDVLGLALPGDTIHPATP